MPYIYDENSTIGGVIEEEAKNYAVQYHALEVNAAAEGVTLTEDDEAAIAALLESDITELVGEDGTEDDLFAILEKNYVSRELYDYMNLHGRPLLPRLRRHLRQRRRQADG